MSADDFIREVEASLTTAEHLLADGLEVGEYDGRIYAAVAASLERARLALRGYVMDPAAASRTATGEDTG